MRRAILLCALVSALSCAAEPPPPESVPLGVLVTDDTGAPVRGAAVDVGGAPAGETDGSGELRARLRGPDGRRCDVGVRCPAGAVPVGGDRREVTVRFLRPISAAGDALAPVELRFTCAPARRRHALVIRTDGRAHLPVLAGGRPLAETDEDGVAQAVLAGEPGEEVEVVIDTSAHPDLRPAMPSRRLVVPERSQILLFDQGFSEEREPPRRRRAPRSPAGPRRL